MHHHVVFVGVQFLNESVVGCCWATQLCCFTCFGFLYFTITGLVVLVAGHGGERESSTISNIFSYMRLF